MATISSPGLGSGLDINGIITKLMSVEQLPLQKLDTTEASYQAKISALGTLQGAVSSLDTALSSLTASSTSTSSITATLANSAVGLVTAGSDASVGSHTLSVSQLAQAHKIATVANGQKLASPVYAGASSTISSGTLTVTIGGTSHDITISSSNATLTGLKNAINAANVGATADIVPQVGGGVRLVLTSSTVGNTGKITTAGLAGFDYDADTDTGTLSQDTASGGKPAAGYNSATDTIAQGTLTIKVGSGTARNVVIDSTNNTLTGLKDAINNANAGVTASLVTKSSTDVRLVLTTNETGASNTIVTSGLTGFDFNAGTGSLSQATADGGQTALDAQLTVDGNSVTSASNTVTTAVTGVTLRLAQTTTSTTTLTVAKSSGTTLAEAASSKFRSFKGTVADSSIASATIGTGASAGTYSLEVSQLATAHRITTPAVQTHQLTTATPKAQQIRSAAFTTTADLTDGVNPSSLDISIGGEAAQTVSVAAGSTISDLKDAINNANVGVTASLVTEGSTSRLVLTSNTAGDGGKITVANLSNMSGFDYDAGTNTGSLVQTQAAQGYSSSADVIAAGTLSISVNGGAATNVTLTAPQNTLGDLKDAINAANAGVTASIVTDGVGVRLQVTSNTVGAAGAVSLSGLSGFEFNSTTKSLSESQAAQGYTSAGQAIATGTLKLTVGSGSARDIVITSANNTLTGLKDAINAANAGVTASLVTTGTSDVRLVITSATTGQAGRINLSGLSGFTFDSSTGTGTMSQSTADGGQAAQSALVKLNGVSITSDSNTITDALQGVTLSLTKTTTTATTLTVSQDKTSTLSGSFTAMVKAYNELAKSVAELGKYDAKTKKGGPLLGNATLRSVSGSIERAFQNTSIQVNGRTLRTSDMGLEIQRDGTVSFNSTKLSSLAGSDYDSLALLAATMGNALKQVTSGALGTKGSITAATNGLNASIADIDKRREVLQRRLTNVEARYRQQFTALDSTLSSMNATSAYLTQQLSALAATTNSTKSQ